LVLLSLIGCTKDSKSNVSDSTLHAQSVIDYINGYTPDSLTNEALLACTPNQIIQVYYQSLIRGDNVTYRQIHSNPVDTLDMCYSLSNLKTQLTQEDKQSKTRTYLVSFNLDDNKGNLFPITLEKVSMQCKLVFEQNCWQIESIEVLN